MNALFGPVFSTGAGAGAGVTFCSGAAASIDLALVGLVIQNNISMSEYCGNNQGLSTRVFNHLLAFLVPGLRAGENTNLCTHHPQQELDQIGRATCRERECQYV